MQGKRHDRVVEMRLCFFSGKVGDYKVPFKSTRKCRSTLWAVRQSIIVDYMDGKIDEETARREANEAIEYVKSVIQQREQIEKVKYLVSIR